MQLTPEQKQAVEAQKANCPFCKIIKGEIPSKKVFEDDKVIGILDINPAAKGHVLLMPKEHYPIMPLIPEDELKYFFVKVKEISKAIKEGMLVFSDTIFIANGAAAGQMSQHFMLHIIPREDNDALHIFTLKKGTIDEKKEEEVYKVLLHNLPIMLKKFYEKYPLPGKKPISYSKDELFSIIEKNPPIKEMILKAPEKFKEMIPKSPEIKALFEGLNIDEIIAEARKRAGVKEETKEAKKEEKIVNYDELKQILEENSTLKRMLLEDTETFRKNVKEIKKLNEIFGEADIDKLKSMFGKEKKKKTEKKDSKKDIDLISRLF